MKIIEEMRVVSVVSKDEAATVVNDHMADGWDVSSTHPKPDGGTLLRFERRFADDEKLER